MKKGLALLTLLLLALPASAQPVPLVEDVPVQMQPVNPPEPTPYEKGMADAKATKKPLIIFVGVPVRKIEGAIVISEKTLDGVTSQVVLYKNGGTGDWYDPRVTTEQLRKDAGLEASVSASPFSESSSRERSQAGIADDSSPFLPLAEQERLKALWPESLERPDGLTHYRRTKWAQRISNDVRQGDVILPWAIDADSYFTNSGPALNPNSHIAHWRTSGGLDKIPQSQWRSYVAVVLPGKIRFWEGTVPVGNAPGGALHKKLWTFPVGTLFVDLLCDANDKPLEVRYREKMADETWHSSVPWADEQQRPAGYVSARHNTGKRCAECHEGADLKDGAQYHLVLRGNDGNRSFPVMHEGTLTPRRELIQ